MLSLTWYLIAVDMLLRLASGAAMPRADSASPVHGCAEQCIKLLCRYYGVQADQNTILSELRPGEKGEASMADISRCIKKLGLDCYGFKGTAEDLFALAHPAILYLKENADDTIGHFAVSMFDAAEDKLTGYDPTMSGVPFEITPDKLDRYWTGKGLVVFPPDQHARIAGHVVSAAAAIVVLLLSILSAVVFTNCFKGEKRV